MSIGVPLNVDNCRLPGRGVLPPVHADGAVQHLLLARRRAAQTRGRSLLSSSGSATATRPPIRSSTGSVRRTFATPSRSSCAAATSAPSRRCATRPTRVDSSLRPSPAAALRCATRPTRRWQRLFPTRRVESGDTVDGAELAVYSHNGAVRRYTTPTAAAGTV